MLVTVYGPVLVRGAGSNPVAVDPIVTNVAMEAFSCFSFEGGLSFLAADVSIQCGSAEHHHVQALALLAIILFPIGLFVLNAALLLLPQPLVRYLLVHELCHLRHLDHSSRYWRLVAEHDPDYREHDAALAAAWTEIPVWALPR